MRANGRAKKKRRWRKLISQFKESNMSAREFCRKNDLSVSSLYYWRKRICSEEKPVFLPVCVAEDTKAATAKFEPLEIVVAGKYVVRICGEFARSVLDDVMTVLEGRAC